MPSLYLPISHVLQVGISLLEKKRKLIIIIIGKKKRKKREKYIPISSAFKTSRSSATASITFWITSFFGVIINVNKKIYK